MSTQPDTKAGMRRTGSRQLTIGARLLLAGGVLFAVGLVLMLATGGFGNFVGVVASALATPLTLAGVALSLAGVVGRRAADEQPFA